MYGRLVLEGARYVISTQFIPLVAVAVVIATAVAFAEIYKLLFLS